MALKNYTLGRGKLYFSTFLAGTQTPEGFRYIGNSPEFSLTIESEDLDHYSSDAGIREKDDSVPLEVTRTGSFTCDDIQPENVALFFYGTSSLVTQASAASLNETIRVKKGRSYQIGRTPTNPSGAKAVSITSAMVSASAKTVGTDYTLDADTGLITILESGSITDDSDLILVYGIAAKSIQRVVSGARPVEGALKYIANNPKGQNYDYDLPFVKITPNGDLALKGDEWQVVPFSLEALKPALSEAIYMNGRPFTPA